MKIRNLLLSLSAVFIISGPVYSGQYADDARLNEALTQYFDENFKSSFELFSKMAEEGNPVAMYRLGIFYEYGNTVKRDKKKAHSYYKQSLNGLEKLEDSKKTNVVLYHLALLYKEGHVVYQDVPRAIRLFKQLSEKNYILGLRALGNCYKEGVGVEQDYNKAKELYEKAGSLGDKDSYYALGKLYFAGKGVEKNYTTAIDYFEKAAGMGDSWSYTYLGDIYLDGKGVDKNIEKALEYYNKALEKQNPGAYMSLAYLYFYGEDKPKDYKMSFMYSQKAAELNYAPALSFLAFHYEYGHGVEKDPYKAFELYSSAADMDYGPAYRALASCYYKGVGVERDYEKSYEQLLKAVERGDDTAMYYLALYYEHGVGTDKDLNKSNEWFVKSADAGYIPAHNLLAERAEDKGDYSEALDWYKKAAALGDADSTANIGYYYEKGLGVEKNLDTARSYYEEAWKQGALWSYYRMGVIYRDMAYAHAEKIQTMDDGKTTTSYKFSDEGKQLLAKAFEFFKQAAEKGHKQAQYFLALMYEQGENGQANIEEAKKWYTKSASQGDNDAKKALERLQKG